MQDFGLLVLWFDQRGDGPVRLSRTSFQRSDLTVPLTAERGAYSGSFKWSSGVKALMLFLLRSAAESLRSMEQTAQQPAPYVLEGGRPSPAASLNDLLTKRPVWIYDVFGTVEGGLPFLNELILRQNADFTRRDQSVALWLDPDRFPAAGIEVRLNGRPVTEIETLEQLAADIADQWSPKKSAKGASDVYRDPQTFLESFKSLRPESIEQHFVRLFDALDDKVELEIAGLKHLGMGGHWRGRDSVVATIRENVGKFEFVQPQIHTLVSDDANIIVMASEECRVRGDRRLHKHQWVQKFQFRDGKIIRMLNLGAPSQE